MRRKINRISSLIWKELLAILRDPKSRASLIFPPLIQLFIFTFAATLDVKNVPIGIYNRDNGKQSFELLQRFRGSPTFSKIVYLESIDQIADFIDKQKGIMVISIDEQFSRLLEARKPAPVMLIFDGRKSNSAQIVAGYAETIIDQYSREFEEKMEVPSENAVLVLRNWFNPNLYYYWYNIPSLVITLSMIVSLIVTSISVARERELGTFDQLLVSPLYPSEIIIGKITPGLIVGTLEGSLMLFMGILFGVPFTGSFTLFFFSLTIFILSICGVGLFISSLCSTQQQAMLGAFVFVVPSVRLSGFATPIENMPYWLQPFTAGIPLKYMLVISKGIFLKKMPYNIVFMNLWPLVVIAMITLTSADILFRRRLE